MYKAIRIVQGKNYYVIEIVTIVKNTVCTTSFQVQDYFTVVRLTVTSQLIIYDRKIRLAQAFSYLFRVIQLSLLLFLLLDMIKIQQNFKRFVSCLETAMKLRQNNNILGNLLKANCVAKDEYDVIIKARIIRYFKYMKNKM